MSVSFENGDVRETPAVGDMGDPFEIGGSLDATVVA
jgi:hypothetical protein